MVSWLRRTRRLQGTQTLEELAKEHSLIALEKVIFDGNPVWGSGRIELGSLGCHSNGQRQCRHQARRKRGEGELRDRRRVIRQEALTGGYPCERYLTAWTVVLDSKEPVPSFSPKPPEMSPATRPSQGTVGETRIEFRRVNLTVRGQPGLRLARSTDPIFWR